MLNRIKFSGSFKPASDIVKILWYGIEPPDGVSVSLECIQGLIVCLSVFVGEKTDSDSARRSSRPTSGQVVEDEEDKEDKEREEGFLGKLKRKIFG